MTRKDNFRRVTTVSGAEAETVEYCWMRLPHPDTPLKVILIGSMMLKPLSVIAFEFDIFCGRRGHSLLVFLSCSCRSSESQSRQPALD